MIEIPLQFKVRGFIRMDAINYFSGKRRQLIDWFPNKVLNDGLNRMGSASDWLNCAQVGTNSTPPQATDTGLLGYVAGTSDVEANTFSATASPPYYGFRRKTYRFARGATAANLSEAGVGWATTEGANLFCRALIVDPVTNLPTTVTPLADEILDLTYELRYYSPTLDWTGTVVLNGVTYDILARAASANSASAWGEFIGTQVGVEYSSGSDFFAYDGSIGSVIQLPNGTSASPSGSMIYNTSYSNNSLVRDMVAGSDKDGWNLGAGIRSVKFSTTGGVYQAQFDAQGTGNPIPKTNAERLQLNFRVSWQEGSI